MLSPLSISLLVMSTRPVLTRGLTTFSSDASARLRLHPPSMFKFPRAPTTTQRTPTCISNSLHAICTSLSYGIHLNSSRILLPPAPSFLVGRSFSCCNEPPELLESDLRLPAHGVLERLKQLDNECIALQNRLSSDLAVSSPMDKREAHERVEAMQRIRHQIEYVRTLQQAWINIQAIEEAKKTMQAREQAEQPAEMVESEHGRFDGERSDGDLSVEQQDRGEASLGAAITDNLSDCNPADVGASPRAAHGVTQLQSADLREIESRGQEAKDRQADGDEKMKQRIKEKATQKGGQRTIVLFKKLFV